MKCKNESVLHFDTLDTLFLCFVAELRLPEGLPSRAP